MTGLQVALLVGAVPATLYQIFVVANVAAAANRYGAVRFTNPLKLMLLLTVALQVLFILSLTGNIG